MNSIQKIAFGILLVCAVVTAQGQFSIDWYKISGGGGINSTGGVYSVGGTVGQHDAGGPMKSGVYSLTGGFWSLFALQTPGAPGLTIVLTSTNTAVVSWPSPSTGFELVQNTNLNTTNWVTPAQTVNDNGVTRFIIVNPPVGNRFFRLRNP